MSEKTKHRLLMFVTAACFFVAIALGIASIPGFYQHTPFPQHSIPQYSLLLLSFACLIGFYRGVKTLLKRRG